MGIMTMGKKLKTDAVKTTLLRNMVPKRIRYHFGMMTEETRAVIGLSMHILIAVGSCAYTAHFLVKTAFFGG